MSQGDERGALKRSGNVKVEHIEHNPDGTTTIFGVMADGAKVARTFEAGAIVTRVNIPGTDGTGT